MKSSRRIVAWALAAAAGSAVAGPTDLGGGTGSFTVGGTKDAAFFVTLDPGTYEFKGTVDGSGLLTMAEVWLSTTHDQNPFGKSTLGMFTAIDPQHFAGDLIVTVPTTESIYLEVNTVLGKTTGDTFSGALTVSAVPESSSLALMATGLGLLGFLARRRRG